MSVYVTITANFRQLTVAVKVCLVQTDMVPHKHTHTEHALATLLTHIIKCVQLKLKLAAALCDLQVVIKKSLSLLLTELSIYLLSHTESQKTPQKLLKTVQG